jgi:hypothetical protein
MSVGSSGADLYNQLVNAFIDAQTTARNTGAVPDFDHRAELLDMQLLRVAGGDER